MKLLTLQKFPNLIAHAPSLVDGDVDDDGSAFCTHHHLTLLTLTRKEIELYLKIT